MNCGTCNRECMKFGKHRHGLGRFRCAQCGKTYTEDHSRLFGGMILPEDKALLAIQLLLEGTSVRSTERITQLHRDTILRLLLLCVILFREQTMATAIKHVPIQNFVAELRKFPEATFDRTEQVRQFLQDTPLNPDSLAPYLTWDRQHYTRNLIDKTPLYELIAVCWEVGQASSVHNHRDQNCWMAVPSGRLLVENFHVAHQDIAGGKCAIKATEIVEMNPSHPCAVDPLAPVHRVLNPREFNQRAVSLHVYSRPFDSCVVYSAEQGTCGEIQLHYTTEYGKPVLS